MKKYFQCLVLLTAFVSLLGLTSCIPDPVEIEVPQAETKLVIASQMLFNQGVLVQVSKSFSALTEIPSSNPGGNPPTEGDSIDEDFLNLLLVDSAQVIIEGPTTVDTLISLSQGFYLSLGTELIENETYRLRVYDSTSGLSVFAQTKVLPQAAFKELDFRFQPLSLDFQDTTFTDSLFQLTISFDDLEGENYYMVNLYKISQNGAPQPGTDLFSFGQGQPTYTFADRLLKGGTFTDTLDYSEISVGDTIGVTLSHISKDYYDFLNTRDRSGNSIFAALLGEPVNYPSNVVDGYGMFNLYFPTTRVLIVE